jgi:hypothetical protein
MEYLSEETILEALRKLPPYQRLKVVSKILPEIEQDLASEPRPLKSLKGLWSDLGAAPSADIIDQERLEAWKNFSREDI